MRRTRLKPTAERTNTIRAGAEEQKRRAEARREIFGKKPPTFAERAEAPWGGDAA